MKQTGQTSSALLKNGGSFIFMILVVWIILFELFLLDRKSNEVANSLKLINKSLQKAPSDIGVKISQSSLDKVEESLRKMKAEIIKISQQETLLLSNALKSKPSNADLKAQQETLLLSNALKNKLATTDTTTAASDKKLSSMHDMVMSLPDREKTDKVAHHRYDRFYDYFLEPLRERNITMLEIGYQLGYSYQMWIKYFPKGSVYYMEKFPFAHVKHYAKAQFIGDQSSEKDLQSLLERKKLQGKLDFIIDDGSHVPSHQIISFKYLWKHALKPGGIYIVEDTEMNYWRQGNSYGNEIKGGKDHPDSIITQFKELVDVVNREYAPTDKPFKSAFGDDVDTWIGSITFGLNCVILTKMTEKDRKRFLTRKYRYKENLDGPSPI